MVPRLLIWGLFALVAVATGCGADEESGQEYIRITQTPDGPKYETFTGDDTPPAPKSATMPDVLGLAPDDAKEKLYALGFEDVYALSLYGDGVVYGDRKYTVVKQDPAAGASQPLHAGPRLAVVENKKLDKYEKLSDAEKQQVEDKARQPNEDDDP